LFTSLVSDAIIVTVCPGFRVCVVSGESLIEIVPVPEHPEKTTAYTRIPNASKECALNFLTVSPLKVVTISVRNSKPLERE